MEKQAILEELKKITACQIEMKQNQKKILDGVLQLESAMGWVQSGNAKSERSTDSNDQENGTFGEEYLSYEI